MKNICNLVEHTKLLARKIDDIHIVYCKKSANLLIDRIAKEYITPCTVKAVINKFFFLVVLKKT